ncbi:MAG: hypothetical protein IE912_10935 [Brevundimonas diminuta]|nr:DUF6551 family protein [Brevundimonas diminuta]MBD3819394.1 hypothetical protein [Brevundimonas diminuta]
MKSLYALTDRCCRWPVGPSYPPGQMHKQLWCGAPRGLGDWYCPEHMRVAFPRAHLTAAQVRARNLLTIKIALTRRRADVTRDEMLEAMRSDRARDIAETGSRILAQTGYGDYAQVAAAAPESEEVAALRARLSEGGEAVAPNLAEIGPSGGDKPADAGFEGGAELGSDLSPAIHPKADNMDGSIHDKGVVQTDTLRPIAAHAFATFDAQPVPTNPPLIEWMSPSDLLIEAAYQRDLSPKSMDLIKRIAERWDWRRFKPPIVAWSERGFEIIDGQHTAIGAATRGIDKIPVLVVEAADLTDRASAFVGHNQDRLAITPIQMHQAKLAAGDEDALTAQQVIDKAGATLVISAYGARGWKPGETVAITTIDQLARKRGAMRARQVVELLVKAGAAPISAAAIKAVDMLMFKPEFAEIDLEHLPAAIIQTGDVEKEAKLDAKTHCIPAWEAMGPIWFRKCRKTRRAA